MTWRSAAVSRYDVEDKKSKKILAGISPEVVVGAWAPGPWPGRAARIVVVELVDEREVTDRTNLRD